MSIQWKILVPLLLLAVSFSVLVGVATTQTATEEVVANSIDSAADTVRRLSLLRSYYTKNVVSRGMGLGIEFSGEYAAKPRDLPLPATLVHELNLLDQGGGHSIRLYSPYPFPWRTDSGQDAFEKDAWIFLNTHPTEPFTRVEHVNGGTTVRYAIADVMVDTTCVQCHNNHPQSPKTGWNLGDVRGVLEVTMPIGERIQGARDSGRRDAVAMFGLMLLGFGVVMLAMRRLVFGRLKKLVAAAKDISGGDLTRRAEVGVNDELGELAASFNSMVGDIQTRELALRESEARLLMALDAARMGSWDWNIRTDQLTWTELVGPILGAAPGPPRFKAYWHVVHPTDAHWVAEAIGATLSGAVPDLSIEHRIVWADGSLHWVEGRGRVYRDAEGAAMRMAGTLTDISERKRTEEALHTAEERLRQSQKMEAIGRLAGGIAHDFNNLLTAIGGFSELALDRLDTLSPVRSDIGEIQHASAQAAELTRQLLAFSRRQMLTPKFLSLNAVLRGVEGLLRRLIGENIEFSCSFAENLSVVRADAGQIEQVIINLAVNARDAMPRGGRLCIATANVDVDELGAPSGGRPGRYVLLTVSDNGEGMDAETQATIFEPFFTTKELGKGTGLGLATVYGIIQQSGGHILVHSESGRGTTFEVYLPRVEGVLPASPPINKGWRDGGAETILLVEDNDGVRRLAHEALESQGYQVMIASNGSEALSVATEHSGRIDLLLTDIVMPGIGGRELSNRLSSSRPDMKVLFMSGYTDDAVVTLDRNAFLPKPFTPSSLTEKVRATLDAERRVGG